jgi:predicted transcriptional regulator
MNTFNVSDLTASEIKILVSLWKKKKDNRKAIITHGCFISGDTKANHKQIKKLKDLGLVYSNGDNLFSSSCGLSIGRNFEFRQIIGDD